MDTDVWAYVPPVTPRTKSATAILGTDEASGAGILRDALDDFLSKNDDYDDASDALGIVGQVSDLWRKVVKMKKLYIDHKNLNGETAEQLLQDIFGHALLAMHYERQRTAYLTRKMDLPKRERKEYDNPFDLPPMGESKG